MHSEEMRSLNKSYLKLGYSYATIGRKLSIYRSQLKA